MARVPEASSVDTCVTFVGTVSPAETPEQCCAKIRSLVASRVGALVGFGAGRTSSMLIGSPTAVG